MFFAGYVDIPAADYATFSVDWIAQAERILKPGASIYIISGWTNLIHILNALKQTRLQEINHIIWKYNFGVYTKTKYIASHYHILYYKKPGARHTFHTYARYADFEQSDQGRSLNYQDREDVWVIPRVYQPAQIKNKNELPVELLIKIMQYSSHEGSIVCDFFLGSFATAKVAKGLNRTAIGFEISPTAFDYQLKQWQNIPKGSLLEHCRKPPQNRRVRQNLPISPQEKNSILKNYAQCRQNGKNKKESLATLSKQFGRGTWSLLRIINDTNDKKPLPLK